MIFRMTRLILVGITLTGCVTLSEKASKVQIHSQMSTLLDGCTKLGPVSSVGSRAVSLNHAVETAKVGLREATADKRGDSVVVLNTDMFLTEVIVQGVAFKCY